MAKDFPKQAEAGIAAPADQPDKVGPVAGNVEPEPSTKPLGDGVTDDTAAVQRLIDDAAKTATAEKPETVAVEGKKFLAQALRLPLHVRVAGVGSPEEHAKALGGVKTIERSAVVKGEPASFQLYHQFHAAAAALHGWLEHEHHEQKPILLTVDDYKAALQAASKPVTRALDANGTPTGDHVDSYEYAAQGKPTITDYEPHAAALSPHKGKGL